MMLSKSNCTAFTKNFDALFIKLKPFLRKAVLPTTIPFIYKHVLILNKYMHKTEYAMHNYLNKHLFNTIYNTI